MSQQNITTVEQFYDLYSQSAHLESLNEHHWTILNQIRSLPNLNEELQMMLSQVFYLIRKRRLQTPVAISA